MSVDCDCHVILRHPEVSETVVLVHSTESTVSATWASLRSSTLAHNKHWLALLVEGPTVEERSFMCVTNYHHVNTIALCKRHQRPRNEAHRLVVRNEDLPVCRGISQSTFEPSLLFLQQSHKPLLANLFIHHKFMLTIVIFTQMLGTYTAVAPVVRIFHV